jgi:hypothetical protein
MTAIGSILNSNGETKTAGWYIISGGKPGKQTFGRPRRIWWMVLIWILRKQVREHELN